LAFDANLEDKLSMRSKSISTILIISRTRHVAGKNGSGHPWQAHPHRARNGIMSSLKYVRLVEGLGVTADKIKLENLKAMVETTREYSVYRK
jgi:hypothetical protein